MIRPGVLTTVLFLTACSDGPESPVAVPTLTAMVAGVTTHADGRKPIQELFAAYDGLIQAGWQLEVVAQSMPAGATSPLPVIALRSPRQGPATWILSGIHGEEPAGPNAIAASIDAIAALGREQAVVLLPLCNPQGYVRNWRYLNVAVYSETVEGQSVGDSSHWLPDAADPTRARAAAASSPEADAITRYVVTRSADYPPRHSIDLHEDNLIHEGYVYSQGALGATDPLAIEAVRVLQDTGIPLKLDGMTRFDEPIVAGIIGPVVDSSIDELMSSGQIIQDGVPRRGPSARTVLVFETPAGALPLARRIAAHEALVRRLTARIALSRD